MNELGYTALAKTYILGETDHDYLQTVLSGKYHGKAYGKTFATVMLMLGEAWLGDPGNVYLYIGENLKWSERVMSETEKVFLYENFTVACGRDRLFVGDENNLTKVFVFWSADGTLMDRPHGCHFTHTFIDVSDDSYYKWVSGTEIEQWKNVSRLS